MAAAAAISLLLRYHVDGAELDEVFLEEDPEPLTPLGQDAAGVPTAPDESSEPENTAGDGESSDA